MFCGIIKEVGIVESLECKNNILDIIVSCKALANEIKVGDSVAVNGCCLTVIEVFSNSEARGTSREPRESKFAALSSQLPARNLFTVQATQETLAKTNLLNLKVGSKVNLEPSLKVGDQIGGHLVLGHVDETGEVVNIIKNGENQSIKILFPKELSFFIASKGSISVNGVSLTVIDVKNKVFSFTLIPFTRDNTNLGLIKIGDLVNLEIDLISRYLINYLNENKELLVSR